MAGRRPRWWSVEGCGGGWSEAAVVLAESLGGVRPFNQFGIVQIKTTMNYILRMRKFRLRWWLVGGCCGGRRKFERCSAVQSIWCCTGFRKIKTTMTYILRMRKWSCANKSIGSLTALIRYSCMSHVHTFNHQLAWIQRR